MPIRAGLHAALRRNQLVWFEAHCEITAAIQREKSLKRWLRPWKIDLIERTNPTWPDLYDDITG